MAHSTSHKPDLDWSQIRETVKLLSLSALQVDQLTKEGDLSVNTLTESFTTLVERMQAIHDHLLSLDCSDSRSEAIRCCDETSDKIQASIVAFQFYDRMVQCLQHVTANLNGLCAMLETPDRIYNPNEWRKFQDEIRSRYTMESEKLIFDAVVHGKSLDEALADKANRQPEADNIELF